MPELDILQVKLPQFILCAIDKLLLPAGLLDFSGDVLAPQPQIFQHRQDSLSAFNNLHFPDLADNLLHHNVLISIRKNLPP